MEIEKHTDFDYGITLNFRKGIYHLCIPDLILSAKGTELQPTYEELMHKRDEFIKSVEEMDINISHDKKRGLIRKIPTKISLQPFFVKWAVSVFMILFSVLVLTLFAKTTFTYLIESSFTNISNTEGKLHSRMESLTSKIILAFNPARQERIINNTRAIVNHLRPFSKELSKIFSEDLRT